MYLLLQILLYQFSVSRSHSYCLCRSWVPQLRIYHIEPVVFLLPYARSPKKMSFGMQSFSKGWTCLSHCRFHFLSRESMLGEPAWENDLALDTQFCQDMPRVSQVFRTCKMLYLPSCICSSWLTSIQQCADDTGIVHCHLYQSPAWVYAGKMAECCRVSFHILFLK